MWIFDIFNLLLSWVKNPPQQRFRKNAKSTPAASPWIHGLAAGVVFLPTPAASGIWYFFIFILDWLLSLDFIHSNSDSAGPNLEISKMESGRRAYGFWPKTPGWMSPCDADNGSTDVSDLMARQ